jgi:hypothetical protein
MDKTFLLGRYLGEGLLYLCLTSCYKKRANHEEPHYMIHSCEMSRQSKSVEMESTYKLSTAVEWERLGEG